MDVYSFNELKLLKTTTDWQWFLAVFKESLVLRYLQLGLTKTKSDL